MKPHDRTIAARDTELSAETLIDSSSFLRKAISNMDSESKKTITSQQTDSASFDNYIEKKK